jgi:hypothetical protein
MLSIRLFHHPAILLVTCLLLPVVQTKRCQDRQITSRIVQPDTAFSRGDVAALRAQNLRRDLGTVGPAWRDGAAG